MIRYVRELRLIPIALIASACLLALKTADLMLDGGQWLLGDDAPAHDAGGVQGAPDAARSPGAKSSWAQQMFNFPNGSGAAPSPDAPPRIGRAGFDHENADITGSIAAKPQGDGKADTAKDPKATVPVKGTVIPTDAPSLPSGAERAILERLQERRQELDTRGRELDIRESLIKAAEKRMEGRLAELKEVEGRITTETQKKDDADATRMKSLVTMYENMKPRDAAKIFDRLEIGVLLEVVSQINPRKMSDILAQMSPDTAERLTVELASKAQRADKNGPVELPKIEGRPTTP